MNQLRIFAAKFFRMKQLFFLKFILLPLWSIAQFLPVQRDEEYLVKIQPTSDKFASVSVVPPLQGLEFDSVVFALPRVVPGTYSISSFGRFVDSIIFYDQHNAELISVKLDDNRWYIPQAKELYRIEYRVNETFSRSGADIFEPAGTAFRKDFALLNFFGIVGYVVGAENYQFEIEIQRSADFYSAGNLPLIERRVDADVFRSPNYFFLHDNPHLLARPDTASVKIANTTIHLAVHSPENFNSAKQIMPAITDLFQAAADYFDGVLPVDDYHILLLFAGGDDRLEHNYGALEHHYSTTVYMPDLPFDIIIDDIRDIVAHEFLHIVTPLNFHSDRVHHFDFQFPTMSRHLWLYEGVTEYTSHLMQVRGGLITPGNFLDIMRSKMESAEEYDKFVPIYTASKYAFDIHESQYLSVYDKGALIAMMLDLQIIISSNGERDLKDLLVDLGNAFGPDTFFVDHMLFDVIAEHGFPGIYEFAARFIEANQPLPYREFFDMVGFDFSLEGESSSMSFGITGFDQDPDRNVLVVISMDEADAVARELGYQVGDRIMKLNGESMEFGKLENTLVKFFTFSSFGDTFEVEVLRPNKKETKFKTVRLKAKVQDVKIKTENLIEPMENPGEARLKLQKKWLTNN